MPIVIAIIALVVVIAGVGYFATKKQPQTTSTTQTPTDEKTLEDGTMVNPDGTMVKPTNGATGGMTSGETMMKYFGVALAGKSAPLLDFTKTDYDAALKSDKLVVLYFYADWCPICKNETASALYPAFNKLSSDKVIGFRVNYKDDQTDNDETNLAREFGVAYQHTKVFMKNGQRILKSPESWDEKRYAIEIDKALTP